jgi:E3 ubiquitin-protein ligase SHPRH
LNASILKLALFLFHQGNEEGVWTCKVLAVAQAQLLRAHDELKMATARLHLRENENDTSMDALGEDELESASVLHSNEKFMSLNLLSHTKGKLRYLKVPA